MQLGPIVIDSDSDDDGAVEGSQISNDSGICSCFSVNCVLCFSEKKRQMIFKLYNCYPITDDDTKAIETVAELSKVSTSSVRHLLNQCHRYLVDEANIDNTPCKKKAPPLGFPNNFPRKLKPLEVHFIKRRLLTSDPKNLLRTLNVCSQLLKYKIDSCDLLTEVISKGNIIFRQAVHNKSKQNELMACEEETTRLLRLAYIQQLCASTNKMRVYLTEVVLEKAGKIMIAGSLKMPISTMYLNTRKAKALLKWLSKYVIPKVNEPSTFIVKQSFLLFIQDIELLQTASKAEIINVLNDKNIEHDASLCKSELYDLLLQSGITCQKKRFEDIFTSAGHSIIYMPPDNDDIDPFEYVLSHVKLKAATNDDGFDINKILQSIPSSKWRKFFNQAISMEKTYAEMEESIDAIRKKYTTMNDDQTAPTQAHMSDYVRC